MVITHAKVERAANALKELSDAVRGFRDCQHNVMFQMSNPSLHRQYDFKECGDALERSRVRLKSALDEADKAHYHICE